MRMMRDRPVRSGSVPQKREKNDLTAEGIGGSWFCGIVVPFSPFGRWDSRRNEKPRREPRREGTVLANDSVAVP